MTQIDAKGKPVADDMAYKILTAHQWDALERDGSFAGAPVDLADGYVHLSTAAQAAETAAKHGDEQVRIWRRSFDIPPPPMEADSPYDLAADRRYSGIEVPRSESLKDTIERVLPYWEGRIAPALREGQRVLISAHGNSLRALVKHLSNIPDDEIAGLEIPTGQPIVYELDGALAATDRYYLSER